MKRLLFFLYILIILVMAAATIVEKYHGTLFVKTHVYGAWWFSALWALLVAAGVAYIVQRKMRQPVLVALHGAFAVILLGALVTHLFGRQGMVQLTVGEPATTYTRQLSGDNTAEEPLGFTITLERFDVHHYAGTHAPSDYQSVITIADATSDAGDCAMNRIVTHRGFRFYQSGYGGTAGRSILA